LETEQQNGEIKPSERIAAKASKLLRVKKVPEQLIKAYEKEKEKEKNEQIQTVKADPTLSPEAKEKKIKQIENKFQFERPFQLSLGVLGSGDFTQ